MNVQPLGQRIAVRPGRFIESELELRFLNMDKEQVLSGTVIAAGPGKLIDSGIRRDMQVKVGDRIVFGQYAVDQETEIDGEAVFMMSEDDVLGVLE